MLLFDLVNFDKIVFKEFNFQEYMNFDSIAKKLGINFNLVPK